MLSLIVQSEQSSLIEVHSRCMNARLKKTKGKNSVLPDEILQAPLIFPALVMATYTQQKNTVKCGNWTV